MPRLAEGVDRIQVETFAVIHRAMAFYAGDGFREIGTDDHSNPAMNTVWLARPLE